MSWAMVVVLLAIGTLIERIFPAVRSSIRGVIFNAKYFVPFAVLRTIAATVVAGGAVAATNALGGGLITLPSTGWLLVPAVAAYALVADFGEYLFHWMEHRIPALWSMHSLHHSEEAMNIVTSYRHFWLLRAIETATIYFPVGLLFKANATVISIYSILSIVVLFSHMNIPVGFGRGWFLLNSPQFHRVHHSALPEHMDKNFANLFPIWDVIFRTAHRPVDGEFPPTGLYDGDTPRSVIEAIIWPMRNVFRRREPKIGLDPQDTTEARVLLATPTARG